MLSSVKKKKKKKKKKSDPYLSWDFQTVCFSQKHISSNIDKFEVTVLHMDVTFVNDNYFAHSPLSNLKSRSQNRSGPYMQAMIMKQN